MNIRGLWTLAPYLILALALVACSKIESRNKQNLVINSSVFNPGERVVVTTSSTAQGGEGGYLPPPSGTGGGTDGGALPGNGTGGNTDGGGTTGGTTAGTNNGGGTTGGNTAGTANGGGTTVGGNTAGTSNGGANGDDGTIPGGGNQGTGNDGGTLGDGKCEVDLARVCTWHGVPMFFEEAKKPIISLEVNTSSEGQMKQLAGVVPGVSTKGMGKRKINYSLASVSLLGVNLAESAFSTKVKLNMNALKSQFTNDWQDQVVRAQVCDDRDGTGMCVGKPGNQIVTAAELDFFAAHAPEKITLDVFSGKLIYDSWYYTHMPKYCERLKSPLVLDLQGNGISLSGSVGGIYFDLDGSGLPVATGWVKGADDAFLARDLNGNGRIDGGHELFGSATRLQNGKTADNGFEALKELDSNNDGVLSSKDAAWDSILLWLDRNGNGLSERSEMVSLASQGVNSIALDYAEVREVDRFGNETRQRSTFTRGTQVSAIVDIWFSALARQ